jgi:hypothetical protein
VIQSRELVALWSCHTIVVGGDEGELRCVWYLHTETVVIVVVVVICDQGGVVLRVVDLHNGDIV